MKRNLTLAKRNKKDEFYTQLYDIENELRHYKKHFKDKVVYCNCDDPRVSKFFHYFSYGFEEFGLKKLIATCYKNQNPDLFSQNDSERAIYIKYKSNKGDNLTPYPDFMKSIKQNQLYTNPENNPFIPAPEDIGIGYLEGDGDFRSKECIELLKQADIVVTNPPFSLFREYVAQLMKFNKKFIIIGNKNAIAYKEIFKWIKEDKMWVGNTPMGIDMLFDVPSDFASELVETKKEGSGYKIIEGVIKGRSQAIWFTNLDISKRHEELILYKTYNKEEYPKYDNYNAINVDKTAHIPIDYDGYMGVPITFLDKYNPDQFEIIGQGQGNLYRELTPKGLSQDFVHKYYKTGGTGSIKEDHPVLGYYNKQGKAVIPYMRIIIKNKNL